MAFFCGECRDYKGDAGHFDLDGFEEEVHMAFKHGFIRNYRSRKSVDGGRIFQGALPGQPAFTRVIEDQAETPPTMGSPGTIKGEEECLR